MALDTNQPLSSLTGARQTMLSWSRVIDSPADLPVPFHAAAAARLSAAPSMPYTVYAPAIAGFTRKTTEKLLCAAPDALLLWERLGERIAFSEYPWENITDWERGAILLFSWIKLSGVTTAGQTVTSAVEFNTASLRHYLPFSQRLRPAPAQVDAEWGERRRAAFEFLGRESYKFMNFASESLLGGESVLHTVWQPEVTRTVLRLGVLNVTRPLLLARLLILTDRELILIQDDERSRLQRGERYGGKWQFFPLAHIQSAFIQHLSPELVALVLGLTPGARRVELAFPAAQHTRLAGLLASLEPRLG